MSVPVTKDIERRLGLMDSVSLFAVKAVEVHTACGRCKGTERIEVAKDTYYACQRCQSKPWWGLRR